MSEQRESKNLCSNKNIRLEQEGEERSFVIFRMGNPSQAENVVSNEERQILDELEADIEEDLEREIIESMCRLGRHLQRLYQHKDTREHTGSTTDYQFTLFPTGNMLLSELNIRVKLDGHCRIDITKVEQDASYIQPKLCPDTSEPDKRQGSLKSRHGDTVYCRKQQNHPIVPWR